MLAQFVAGPVNHVLRGESWALRRLQPYAGRTVRFEVLPVDLCFIVRDNGEIAPAPAAVAADVTVRLTPPAALRILGGDETAFNDVILQGDSEFAEAIHVVARNARWDAEEDLARVLGDRAAHRVGQVGRRLFRFHARAADSLTRNLFDYWVEERPLIARRSDIERFVLDVDTLRDDVERLAQRVANLGSR